MSIESGVFNSHTPAECYVYRISFRIGSGRVLNVVHTTIGTSTLLSIFCGPAWVPLWSRISRFSTRAIRSSVFSLSPSLSSSITAGLEVRINKFAYSSAPITLCVVVVGAFFFQYLMDFNHRERIEFAVRSQTSIPFLPFGFIVCTEHHIPNRWCVPTLLNV